MKTDKKKGIRKKYIFRLCTKKKSRPKPKNKLIPEMVPEIVPEMVSDIHDKIKSPKKIIVTNKKKIVTKLTQIPLEIKITNKMEMNRIFLRTRIKNKLAELDKLFKQKKTNCSITHVESALPLRITPRTRSVYHKGNPKKRKVIQISEWWVICFYLFIIHLTRHVYSFIMYNIRQISLLYILYIFTIIHIYIYIYYICYTYIIQYEI